jgi:hypothetical protein
MSPEDIAYNEGVRDTLMSTLKKLEARRGALESFEEPGVELVRSILAEALVLANGTRTRRISQN